MKSYHDAAVEYLTRYTRDFAVLGGGENTGFTLDGEKYTADNNILFVGYKADNSSVFIAWGDPKNRFRLQGQDAVLLTNSNRVGGADLLCLYQSNDIGSGSHVYAVNSVHMGARYIH